MLLPSRMLCLLWLMTTTTLYLGVAGEETETEKTCTAEGECAGGGEDEQEEEPEELPTIQEAVNKCPNTECVAAVLSTHPSFRADYWERRPLLLKNPPKILGDAKLDWNALLGLVDEGLMWTGHGGNSMVEVPKDNSSSFTFDVRNKNTPMDRSQLKGDLTLLMGSIQTLHDGAAELVLNFQKMLGMVANGNVYATKGRFQTVATLHTSRMDNFVVQTSGKKRWRVYQPEVVNPVWGVYGKAEWGTQVGGKAIPESMVGELLIDAILEPGDILYVPRGFPQTTSTALPASAGKKQKEPSVAISIYMHTEAHHIVYEKMIRCALSRSGFCDAKYDSKGKTYCPIGKLLTEQTRSNAGKVLRMSLPVGFLTPGGAWMPYAKEVADTALSQLAKLMKRADKANLEKKEEWMMEIESKLPETAGRVFQAVAHDTKLLEEKTFAGNNDDVPFYERQQYWQKVFGQLGPFQGGYCHEGGPPIFFQDYFADDFEPDEFSAHMSFL